MLSTRILLEMEIIEENEEVLFQDEELKKDFSRFENQLVWLHMKAFNSGRLSLVRQALQISRQDDQLREEILSRPLHKFEQDDKSMEHLAEIVQEMKESKEAVIEENGGFAQWTNEERN